MTLGVNSDRFAMFARCPLLTQQRPNRFVTASDVTDHKRTLGYYLESSALMASSRSRSCGLKLWSASVLRPSEGSLKAVVVPEQFPVRRHETRRAENAEPAVPPQSAHAAWLCLCPFGLGGHRQTYSIAVAVTRP